MYFLIQETFVYLYNQGLVTWIDVIVVSGVDVNNNNNDNSLGGIVDDDNDNNNLDNKNDDNNNNCPSQERRGGGGGEPRSGHSHPPRRPVKVA